MHQQQTCRKESGQEGIKTMQAPHPQQQPLLQLTPPKLQCTAACWLEYYALTHHQMQLAPASTQETPDHTGSQNQHQR
jgi:hypothetical protein